MYIFLKYLSFLYLKNNLSVDNERKCEMLSLCSIAGLLEIYTPCSIAGNVALSLLSLEYRIQRLAMFCLGNCFDKCKWYDLVSLSIVLECHINCMPAVTVVVFPVLLYIRD